MEIPSGASIIYYDDSPTLTVSSAYGTAVPAAGTTQYGYNDPVSARVAAPAAANGTRRVCTGWTGTGSVPASGTATNVSFRITENSTLRWNWRTDHWIEVSKSGNVAPNFTSAWVKQGSTVTVTWPDPGASTVVRVSGDTDGTTFDEAGRTLAIPADRPRSLSLAATTLTLADALDETKPVWSTGAVAPWTPQASVTKDGEDAAISAAIGGGAASVLEAAVEGPGTFAWSWKIDRADLTGIDAFVDGALVESLSAAGAWSTASAVVSGTGPHVVRFEYWNESGSTANRGYLDCVSWTGSSPGESVWYVDAATGDDSNGGLSPETALRTIQAAFDVAADGGEVVVADGVYTGSANANSAIRNTKNKTLSFRSVNGAERTIVDGGGRGRCIEGATKQEGQTGYIHETYRHLVTMDGFTFRNGNCQFGGGGVLTATLKNCIVTGNTTRRRGVVTEVNLENCLISGNMAWNDTKESCAPSAAFKCSLVNCTVVANTNMTSLGAVAVGNSTVKNCIIVGNAVSNELVAAEVGGTSSTVTHSCLDTETEGTGNIVADPRFVDAAADDYRLAADSPCIDAGDDASVRSATDLAGNERIYGRHVDMGAYENRDFFALNANGAEVVYDGQAHQVAATATCPGAMAVLRYALAEDGPYSETNPSFTNAGTNTVWVVASAEGEEPITNSAQVVILPKPVESVMFEPIQEQVFDGTEKTPSIVPTADWSTVLTTEDYATQYENNIEVGVASIIVTGARNCSGQITIPFTILEPADTVWFVDAERGCDENSGRSWDNALQTIQRAANRAVAGNTVLVTNGVYESFTTDGLGITIRSIEGPVNTIVDGGGVSRCAFLGFNTNDVEMTTLVGFTLRNGRNMHGTGAFGGVVENCVITGNYAGKDNDSSFEGCGGGLFKSIARNCVISNNMAQAHGGGVDFCEVSHCIIVDNQARGNGAGARRSTVSDSLIARNVSLNDRGSASGGGARNCRLVRCTVAGNLAGPGGSSNPGQGGIDSCQSVENCIIYGNKLTDGTDSNANGSTITYSCLGSSVSGTGNIVADPLFVDAANGNYRLAAGSLCVDAGKLTSEAKTGTDLDGHPRWIGSGTDMGCYEWATHYAAATQYVAQATGNDANDGLTWETAKKTIQNAIDWATDGDEIVVAAGVYKETESATCGLYNERGVNVLIRSTDGPLVTAIDGDGARRVIKGTASSTQNSWKSHALTLDGFTIRNGFSSGVGIAAYCVFRNCNVTGNTAGMAAGLDFCRLENCLVFGNVADAATGSGTTKLFDRTEAVNCTVTGNGIANTTGSSLFSRSTVINSVIYGNQVGAGTSFDGDTTVSFSCSETMVGSTGNIAADPKFVDAAIGDYRLAADSPCIDAGAAGYLDLPFDLDGNPRVKGRAIDIGCYEFQTIQTETATTPVPVPFAWLDKYPEALATNGGDYEAFGNARAANGADKVWQCYVSGVNPTNATERFLAQIAVTNGTADVWWTPDLNEGGTKSERVYTIEGKTSLVDQSWGPTNESTRFFRVKVEMP